MSALVICLQKAQVDIVEAVQEKTKQAELAAKAEAQASELRAVIEASGSENMQRVVALLGAVQSKNGLIEALQGLVQSKDGLIGALDDLVQAKDRAIEARDELLEVRVRKIQALKDDYDQLLDFARRLQQQSDKYRDYFVDAAISKGNLMRQNVALQSANKRHEKNTKRARETCEKLRGRLYRLEKRARKAGKA